WAYVDTVDLTGVGLGLRVAPEWTPVGRSGKRTGLAAARRLADSTRRAALYWLLTASQQVPTHLLLAWSAAALYIPLAGGIALVVGIFELDTSATIGITCG